MSPDQCCNGSHHVVFLAVFCGVIAAATLTPCYRSSTSDLMMMTFFLTKNICAADVCFPKICIIQPCINYLKYYEELKNKSTITTCWKSIIQYIFCTFKFISAKLFDKAERLCNFAPESIALFWFASIICVIFAAGKLKR